MSVGMLKGRVGWTHQAVAQEMQPCPRDQLLSLPGQIGQYAHHRHALTLDDRTSLIALVSRESSLAISLGSCLLQQWRKET